MLYLLPFHIMKQFQLVYVHTESLITLSYYLKMGKTKSLVSMNLSKRDLAVSAIASDSIYWRMSPRETWCDGGLGIALPKRHVGAETESSSF